MTSLRVVTMNVLSPEHADWDRRRVVLRTGLQHIQADVVALQETVRVPGYDAAADLLGPEFTLISHSERSADGVGAVLASRWPVETVREIDLRVTPRVSLPWAAAVAAEVRLPPPLGLTVLVHHKPTYEVGFARERELQAVAAARFVEDQIAERDLHVVLMGDFDNTPDSSSIRFWTGRQSLAGFSVAYRDAWESVHPNEPGHTFSPANPLVTAGEMSLEQGRRIDYVLVRCGRHGPSLEVLDCRRVFTHDVDGTWASDHFGVLAELGVPRHAPGAWAL